MVSILPKSVKARFVFSGLLLSSSTALKIKPKRSICSVHSISICFKFRLTQPSSSAQRKKDQSQRPAQPNFNAAKTASSTTQLQLSQDQRYGSADSSQLLPLIPIIFLRCSCSVAPQLHRFIRAFLPPALPSRPAQLSQAKTKTSVQPNQSKPNHPTF